MKLKFIFFTLTRKNSVILQYLANIFEPELCGGITVRFRCPHSRTQVLPGLFIPHYTPSVVLLLLLRVRPHSVRSVCLSACCHAGKSLRAPRLHTHFPAYATALRPFFQGHILRPSRLHSCPLSLSYLPILHVAFGRMRPLSLSFTLSLSLTRIRLC